jgi:uncharacterized protein (DUF427 family)
MIQNRPETSSVRSASSTEKRDMSFASNIVEVRPFNGTVNVLYRGAVIASSGRALTVKYIQGATRHFVPFRDINFEFLARSESGRTTETGNAAYWDVVAVGERIPAAVAAFEKSPAKHPELIAHAVFASDRLQVDIVPSSEKKERIDDWPQ